MDDIAHQQRDPYDRKYHGLVVIKTNRFDRIVEKNGVLYGQRWLMGCGRLSW